jgi:pseudaminic acid synthase
MIIGKRDIGRNHPPFLVAEMSCNHDGSLARALRIIKEAKLSGADAIKFQCYDADSITIKSDRPEFQLTDGMWKGYRLYDLYSKAQTPMSWFPVLKACAEDLDLIWFSSVFCERGLDVLENLGCPAYKIASCELVDIPLIEMVSKTRKPVIMSTGLAEGSDTNEALKAADRDNNQIAILHCIAGYPAPAAEYNISKISEYIARYPHYQVGVSDHSTGSVVPIASVAVGATIIEKHFTDVKQYGGLDSEFSMTPPTFKSMSIDIKEAWEATLYSYPISEEPQRNLRRSLWVVKDIVAGDVLSAENIRAIRPSGGLPPRYYKYILGSTAVQNIKAGTPLTEGMIKEGW